MTESNLPQHNRREQILSAAEAVFGERGFAAATIDAVAERAGIAKGSVYNYFKSKRELFYEVFAHAVAGVSAETEGLVTGGMSPGAKLEAVLDLWAGRIVELEHVGRLVLEFWATAARQEEQSDLAQTFQQMYAVSRRQLTVVLEAGAASGRFRSDLDAPMAASLIMAALDGFMIQSILDMGIRLDRHFVEAMKRTVLAAVLLESAQGGPPGGAPCPHDEEGGPA